MDSNGVFFRLPFLFESTVHHIIYNYLFVLLKSLQAVFSFPFGTFLLKSLLTTLIQPLAYVGEPCSGTCSRMANLDSLEDETCQDGTCACPETSEMITINLGYGDLSACQSKSHLFCYLQFYYSISTLGSSKPLRCHFLSQ